MNDSILDTIERLEGAMSAARENVAGQIELLKRQPGLSRQLPHEIVILRRRAAEAWRSYNVAIENGITHGPALDELVGVAEGFDRQASEAYDRWQADGGLSVPLPY